MTDVDVSMDVISPGDTPPPRWHRYVPVVAALVVGAAAGYAIGTNNAPAPVTATSAAAEPATPISADGNKCSAQNQDRLQLGVSVVNHSSAGIPLQHIEVRLPLNGMRVAGTAWGSCGQLTVPGTPPTLDPGATIWLSATFDVEAQCIAPLPVQFRLTYTYAGTTSTVDVGGFADLGGILYRNDDC
jgi:hypothetical protein